MMIRLRVMRRVGRDTFRLTLDLIDPDQGRWRQGDCTVRLDLVDQPSQQVIGRGLVRPALDAYRLSPGEAPPTADARLLWEMGYAIHAYVNRLFEAGIPCLFAPPVRPEASEPTL
jgi:hypothetical protein